MPLGNALGGRSGVATDGLALDTLAQAGDAYYTESMIRPDGSAAVAQELWTRLLGQVMRHATRRALSPQIDDELKSLARRQFMAEAKRFRGHPAEVVLTFYATRTVRGISLTPNAVLGADLATSRPCTDHGVATALLATRPSEKFGAEIYRALFERANPVVGALPSTHDRITPPAITRVRRGLSTAAVSGYERVLESGPLGPMLSAEIGRHLADGTLGEGLADPTLHRGVLAITLFHLWHERYRDRLGGDDPLDELAGALPGRVADRQRGYVVRVNRRPATGEASSSRAAGLLPGPASAVPGSALGSAEAAAAASIWAIRSGVSSSTFSSSIRFSQAAPSAALRASTSTLPRSSDLSISSNSASTSSACGHLSQRLSVGEDQALVLGPGDPEVRVRGLADPVDRAAEHRHLDRLGVLLEAGLDLGDHRVHVELEPATGRTRDQHRAALTQAQRLEDLPGDLDLLLRVEGREADPDRVADPVGEQRPEADGRLQRSRPLGPRLGDPEVDRVLDLRRQEAVGGDRVGDVGRLDGDLEVLELEPLHQLDELDRGVRRAPRRGSERSSS